MSSQFKLEDLLQQAKIMQEKVQAAHAALSETTIEGHSGDEEAGVTVKMDGSHGVSGVIIKTALLKILLDPLAVDVEKLEQVSKTLSQIVTSAFNDAVQKVNQVSRKKLGELAADIQPNLTETDH